MSIGKLLAVGCAAGAITCFAQAGEAENWVWLRNENIISNSVWSLRAYEKDGELYMGVEGSSTHGAAVTGRGAGELDLSQPVVGLDANGIEKSWSIVGFRPWAFSYTREVDTPVTSFIFPTTTKSLPDSLFRGFDGAPYSSTLTNVVMITPECTGSLGTWAFCHNMGLKNILIRAPKLTSIPNQALNCSIGRSDFSEWDLSSLTSIGDCAFGWTGAKGTLTVPKLISIDNALYSAGGHTNIVMGTAYTLADARSLTITRSAFYNNASLRHITFGPYETVVFSSGTDMTKVFGNNANMKTVTFKGCVFANASQLLDAMFIALKQVPEYSKARQVVIYASRNMGWAAIAKEPTAAELALMPDGVDAADVIGVYETQAGERKAWVVHRESEHEYGLALTVRTQDERFNDTYEMLSGDLQNGNPRFGSEVTIRAVCDETEFRGWEDVPEGAVVNGLEMTFTMPGSPNKMPLLKTSPKWTYLPDEGVISNRIWKLNVTTDGLASGRLRIGKSTYTGASAYAGMGEGILDLSGEITDAGGGKWIITHLGLAAMAVSADFPVLTNPVTKIVFPLETESVGNGFIRASIKEQEGPKHSNVVSHLYEVVMDVPNLKNGTGDSTFLRNKSLKKIYLNAPQLTRISNQSFNAGSGIGETDVTLWNVTNVCEIEGAAFGWCWEGYGHFKLDSVTNLYGSALLQMRNTALDLGTRWAPKDRQYLTVANKSFGDMPAVTSVVFGAYTKLVQPADAVPFDFKNIKHLRFLGRVPQNVTEFIDSVLHSRAVPDAPSKYAVIRASEALGWGSVAAPLQAGEEAACAELEATLGPGESVTGVYVDGAGRRVAWLVHSKSPYDPNGTYLIIR